MAVIGTFQHHITIGQSSGHGIGTGLNPVGDHLMHALPQIITTLDRDNIGARPLNGDAHRHQALGQIGDLRLPRGIDQTGFTLGKAGRHHQVFSRANRYFREDNFVTVQSFRGFCFHIAASQLDIGTELLQPAQMQINRTIADGATTGQRHPC